MDFSQYCVHFIPFALVLLHLGPSYGVLAVVIGCLRGVAVRVPTNGNRVRFVRYGGPFHPIWFGRILIDTVFEVPDHLGAVAITQDGGWLAGPLREPGAALAIVRLENWIGQ